MLPGPQVDLTLKRFFVALVWLDLVLLLVAAAHRRIVPQRGTSKSPAAFFIGLIIVILATVLGSMFQLLIPVHAGAPGARLYLMDDWALHIGMAALSVATFSFYARVPAAVLVTVVVTPALTEFLRICFFVNSKQRIIDPMQLGFDIIRAVAQLAAALSLLGARWLVMAPVGRCVWRIGRLGWELPLQAQRLARRLAPAMAHSPDAAAQGAAAADDDDEDVGLLAGSAAPVVDDAAAVRQDAMGPPAPYGVSEAERDLLDQWTASKRAAALELERQRGVIGGVLEDGTVDVSHDTQARVERQWTQLRYLLKTAVTMRGLRSDPVVRLLWARWGTRYMFLMAIKLLVEGLGLLTPVLLRVLMDAFAVPTHRFNEPGAYAIVTALAAANLLAAVCRAHYTVELQKIAMHARSMLSIAVTRHALALKRHEVAGAGTSAGEIATHMTLDVARVTDQIPCFNDLWALPAQALLALYLLYRQVSFAFLAGLLITLVLIPLNMKLAKRIGGVNTELLKHNDERVLRVTEVLSNFKAVKMCGWAQPMLDWIAEPRALYVEQLRWLKLLDAWCVFFWATTPIFVSLATFAVFVWMGGNLTPGRAIAALSLFSTLIMPLNAYPWVINGAVEANVSRGRLSKFLRRFELARDEVPVTPSPCDASGDDDASSAIGDTSSSTALAAPAMTTTDGAAEATRSAAADATEMAPTPAAAEATTSATDSPVPPSSTIPIAASGEEESPVNADAGDDGDDEASQLVCSAVDVRVLPAMPAEVAPAVGEGSNPATAASEKHAGTTPSSSLSSPFELRVDSFVLELGELVLLVGEPGSGKSTLLHALVGEALALPAAGSAASGDSASPPVRTLAIDRTRLSVAFVPQQPFLIAGSIEENIVFGSVEGCAVDHARYSAALKAAALDDDLRDMRRGDQTDVGERGSALSGGQRLRVALARAWYSGADVLLLDDPLGCLDASVCKRVVDNFVLPMAAEHGRAVVIATHRTEFFPSAQVARVYRTEAGRTTVHASTSICSGRESSTGAAREAKTSPDGPPASSDGKEGEEDNKEDGDEDLFAEKVGTISLGAIGGYFRRVGHVMCGLVVLFLVGMQVMRNVSDWYVAHWVAHGDHDDPAQFLNVLFALAVLNAVFAIGRSFLFAVAGLKAAVATHDRLLTSVLGTSITFFTDTSTGALINRVSKDVYCIDDSLPFTLNIVLAQFFLLLGAVVVIVFNSGSVWATIFVMVPGFVLYAVVQRPYRYANRAVKRVEAEARSPVIDYLVQLVEGGPVLRAAGPATSREYLRRTFAALDALQRWNWNLAAFGAWFSLMLQLIGCAVLIAVAYSAVAYRARATPASAAATGLALAYVGPLASYLSALLGAATELEKNLVSVERVHDFVGLPPEHFVASAPPMKSVVDDDDDDAPLVMAEHATANGTEDDDDGAAVSDGGAAVDHRRSLEGTVVFERVSMRYNANGTLVLRDVSLTVAAGAKVAVVGRTGAGKSSLIAALLRLRPLADGRIIVGGVAADTLTHDEHRQRIAVLPQDPFVRHGTVRENLLLSRADFGADAVREAPSKKARGQRKLLDRAMRKALDDVGLAHLKLDDEVGEQGGTLSAGQRQLLGIARVLLSGCDVVVMDEPNAALDASTATKVDAAIRTRLAERTVICVTHKLRGLEETFTHVVVLHRGAVAEQGPPAALLAKEGSVFHRLVADSRGEDMEPS